MNIPIRTALMGIEVLRDLFAGGGATAARIPTGTPFSDYMKLNGYANLVGDGLDATQRSRLQQMVTSGNIAQAVQMLQSIATQQGLAAPPPYPEGSGF